MKELEKVNIVVEFGREFGGEVGFLETPGKSGVLGSKPSYLRLPREYLKSTSGINIPISGCLQNVYGYCFLEGGADSRASR
jgi:hypothetical protein